MEFDSLFEYIYFIDNLLRYLKIIYYDSRRLTTILNLAKNHVDEIQIINFEIIYIVYNITGICIAKLLKN